MASVGSVNLTIASAPNGANVIVTVSYTLAGDAVDVALQTPYREICQIIGDDTPGDGTDDIIGVIHDNITFFPDPATSNPILARTRTVSMPLADLDEDKGSVFLAADEIRAKVTLIRLAPNFRESAMIRLFAGPVILQGRSPGGASDAVAQAGIES